MDIPFPIELTTFLSTEFLEYNFLPSSNELESQTYLHGEANIKGVRQKMVNWIKESHEGTSFKSIPASENFREKGNVLFRSDKKNNSLEAAQCYTEAILTAPDGSIALALAHANRSAAIAEFGYYKEAYEDCECAIQYGYPDKNLPKIRIRQAFCASKLNDYEKLKFCLEKLEKMHLIDQFAKQKSQFENDLAEIQKNLVAKNQESENIQTIVKGHLKDHHLIASQDIEQGEIVLDEKCFSVSPIFGCNMCHYCAAERFIPFPCNVCSKVVYCSLKCKNEHYMVHRFECYAYRCGLAEKLSVLFYSLNTVINGLPSIVPHLRDCTSPKEIWERIETITKSHEDGYSEILALNTNFEKLAMHENFSTSLCAGLLTYYLLDFTSFFTLFEGCACSTLEWSIIVSALLLRHNLQRKFNCVSGMTMFAFNDSYDYHALSKIWVKPHHLKKGLMHSYSTVSNSFMGAFPKISSCSSSCVPSVTIKHDKNRLIAIARHKIRKDSKIYNSSIVPEYRSEPKLLRQSMQKLLLHPVCKCSSCTNGDREFLSFHRFHCQNISCKRIFNPTNSELRWHNHDENPRQSLTCPTCKTKLKLDWYWSVFELMKDPTKIMQIFQIFKYSGKIFVDVNETRLDLASEIIKCIFHYWDCGFPISDAEFKELGEIVKYLLYATEHVEDVISVEYVLVVTFALDLMAQDKYIDFDLAKIRSSFCMLTEDLQVTFDNYIKDYIKVKF